MQSKDIEAIKEYIELAQTLIPAAMTVIEIGTMLYERFSGLAEDVTLEQLKDATDRLKALPKLTPATREA